MSFAKYFTCMIRTEIEHMAELLPDILKITASGNGFYPDGSFLYHTSIPYNASYGEVLLHALVKNLELFYYIQWDMKDYIKDMISTYTSSIFTLPLSSTSIRLCTWKS